MIDAIDVVAILVPEEDAWQFEAAETCIPETQLLDREQETIEVVDHEDPSTSEAIDAYDAITGERLDIQKRCGRDEPKRCEDKMKLNSKWRSTNQRCERRRASTSGHGGWTHEKGPASSAVRCRLCATKVNTGEPRSDAFASFELRATSELQAQASKCINDHHCV